MTENRSGTNKTSLPSCSSVMSDDSFLVSRHTLLHSRSEHGLMLYDLNVLDKQV